MTGREIAVRVVLVLLSALAASILRVGVDAALDDGGAQSAAWYLVGGLFGFVVGGLVVALFLSLRS